MKHRQAFASSIKPYVSAELEAAASAEISGNAGLAFAKLERAHVLGQASTVQHVRVHCRMLAWAWRYRSAKEFFGQLLRIVGAVTKTAVGLVPTGNTGGSNISPFKQLAVAPELAAIIAKVKEGYAMANWSFHGQPTAAWRLALV